MPLWATLLLTLLPSGAVVALVAAVGRGWPRLRGRWPIAVGPYQPPAPTQLPPKPPISDVVGGVPGVFARMVKLHCFNHAPTDRVVDFVNSQVRKGRFHKLKGAAVVPCDSLPLAAHVATGENIALTVWMVDGEPWPEDVREVRLLLNGKTRAGERVRWRGKVRIRRYSWAPPGPHQGANLALREAIDNARNHRDLP